MRGIFFAMVLKDFICDLLIVFPLAKEGINVILALDGFTDDTPNADPFPIVSDAIFNGVDVGESFRSGNVGGTHNINKFFFHPTPIGSGNGLLQAGVPICTTPVKSDVDFEYEGVPIHLAILG
jgi:hypothetical protein